MQDAFQYVRSPGLQLLWYSSNLFSSRKQYLYQGQNAIDGARVSQSDAIQEIRCCNGSNNGNVIQRRISSRVSIYIGKINEQWKKFRTTILRRVRKIAKSNYQLRYVRPSVCTHGITPPPLDRLSSIFIFEYILKMCRENSSFIKTRQE